MTRMAIRGLFARKLRSALTGFAVVIGVAFVAGTFIFTDTINESFKDLFERVSKGVDVNVTANQPVEGDFGGRILPLPRDTLERVESAPGVEAAEPRFEVQVAIFDEQRERVGGNGPPSIAFSASEERFDPFTYVEGGPAREAGQATIDEATADREGFAVGDSILVGGRAPAERVRDHRHHERRRPALDRHPDAEHAARGGAADRAAAGRGHRGRRRGRERDQPRGAEGLDRVGDRRRRDRPDRRGAGRRVRRRHQRVARLHQDRAARVRGHRRARRRLPDLQHVRGHGRPALARVRAAAHARRLAPPGAQLRDRRDAADRLRRLGGRDPLRPPARAGAALAARVVRDRPAVDRHRDRTADRDRRPGRRHARDARVGARAGAPRDARRAGRGDARRRHGGREARQPQAARGLGGGHPARPRVAARRPVRRRRRLRGGGARRPRARRDDLRRRVARPGARAPAGARDRRAARAPPGHAGAARARERRAPAPAHRDHRVGADDRPRARRLHGDLRGRPARLDRQGDRRAAQPLGADRHPRRRLLAGASGRLRAARADRRASPSSRRCAGTRPTSRASATRSRPTASTRRPSPSCSSRRSTRAASRGSPRCATTRRSRRTRGRRATTSRSATRSRSPPRRASG